MALWLPNGVTREMEEVGRQYAADLLRSVHETLGYWNERLQEVDPYLQLVRADPSADIAGVKPGYYHIIRHCPGAPPAVRVHQGPNGEFREPDSGMLRDLAEGDMWSDRTRKEQEKRARDLRNAAQREKEREGEERREELHERIKAAWNPGVSFADVRWTNKAGARR